MRTNNATVKNIILSLYFVLIIATIFFATVFRAFRNLTSNTVLSFAIVAFVFVGLLYFIHTVSKYFEYDSDGVKVVVINKGLLFFDKHRHREYKLEFNKERLLSFKFHNYIIYKQLIINVLDSSDEVRKMKFNVTLVSRRKRKYIRQSLSKMIKANRKNSK
ncbi:hypothetical protein [Ichthyenterobacterium magnum]|uniref:PH (Pleckstrin Homology) domain-containing protein n=1 Tax=Ichthyenterobacterium magnum TaxID=1230530 RepID=A0A420DM09_9FLAO|nr:hypothetical protein [Ichthyenterobacterium magnum]RKE95282.1 hypothetical protein BXY80_1469 [Ichthyenterobacterium magnum]